MLNLSRYPMEQSKLLKNASLIFLFLFRKTSMISRVFISFSAVQIDDLSYIHLIFFIIYGFITNSQSDQLTKWLDSSVDRTLHRYRTGHGFKSRSGLKLFSGVHNCLSCVQNCDDQSCLYISELFIIITLTRVYFFDPTY